MGGAGRNCGGLEIKNGARGTWGRPRPRMEISADRSYRRGESLRESARSAGDLGDMCGSVSSSFRGTKIQNNPLCIDKMQKMRKVAACWKKATTIGMVTSGLPRSSNG